MQLQNLSDNKATFVRYNLATDSNAISTPSQALQEYWIASNGIFLRSTRDLIDACIQLNNLALPGLAQIQPYLKFNFPLIPERLVAAMLELAQKVGDQEILFYLAFRGKEWELVIPDQIATATSVKPAEPVDPVYHQALIEVHSHHRMQARFSATDNEEESGKFRIFAVLGEIFTSPAISVRLGIYNYFQLIPANKVFELPPDLNDANRLVL